MFAATTVSSHRALRLRDRCSLGRLGTGERGLRLDTFLRRGRQRIRRDRCWGHAYSSVSSVCGERIRGREESSVLWRRLSHPTIWMTQSNNLYEQLDTRCRARVDHRQLRPVQSHSMVLRTMDGSSSWVIAPGKSMQSRLCRGVDSRCS
jgi:hypothetical protein